MQPPNSVPRRVKSKTNLDGDLRFRIPAGVQRDWSFGGEKFRIPTGLILVLLISGWGRVRAGAAPLSGEIPASALTPIAVNAVDPDLAGTHFDFESLGKRSFRSLFKRRGADLDNRMYPGSEAAAPPSDPVSHSPAKEWHQLTPKMWIAGEVALMVGTGFAGFLILSHTEKISAAGATGAGAN